MRRDRSSCGPRLDKTGEVPRLDCTSNISLELLLTANLRKGSSEAQRCYETPIEVQLLGLALPTEKGKRLPERATGNPSPRKRDSDSEAEIPITCLDNDTLKHCSKSAAARSNQSCQALATQSVRIHLLPCACLNVCFSCAAVSAKGQCPPVYG